MSATVVVVPATPTATNLPTIGLAGTGPDAASHRGQRSPIRLTALDSQSVAVVVVRATAAATNLGLGR